MSPLRLQPGAYAKTPTRRRLVPQHSCRSAAVPRIAARWRTPDPTGVAIARLRPTGQIGRGNGDAHTGHLRHRFWSQHGVDVRFDSLVGHACAVEAQLCLGQRFQPSDDLRIIQIVSGDAVGVKAMICRSSSSGDGSRCTMLYDGAARCWTTWTSSCASKRLPAGLYSPVSKTMAVPRVKARAWSTRNLRAAGASAWTRIWLKSWPSCVSKRWRVAGCNGWPLLVGIRPIVGLSAADVGDQREIGADFAVDGERITASAIRSASCS